MDQPVNHSLNPRMGMVDPQPRDQRQVQPDFLWILKVNFADFLNIEKCTSTHFGSISIGYETENTGIIVSQIFSAATAAKIPFPLLPKHDIDFFGSIGTICVSIMCFFFKEIID